MSSIGGSFYTGVRNGVSGLATGLDTDSIVEGMTYHTRNRINDVLRDTQEVQWKMDAYQSISSKINDFSNNYLSYSSSTNLFSNSFFSSSEITTSGTNSQYVKATGSSSMLENLAITGIQQVATATSYQSSVALSGNKITTGTLDFSEKGKEVSNFSGMSMSVSYGSNTYTVKFDENFKPTSAQDIADEFNRVAAEIEMSDGGALSDKIGLSVNGDKLEFARKGPADSNTFKISGASSAAGLAAMGFKVGSQISSGQSTLTSEIAVDTANFVTNLNFNDTISGTALTFNLNGLTKNIVFEDSANFADANEFNTYLQDKLNATFGEGRVVSSVSGGAISFQVNNTATNELDPTSKLTISSTNTNLVSEKGIFGIDNNTSNKVDVNEKLGDSSFGLTFDAEGKGAIIVNDVTIEYTENDTIDSLIDRVNASDAGVTMTYMETSDTFSIIADDKGAQGRIDFKNAEGSADLTGLLFGGDLDSESAGVKVGQDSIITIKYDGMPEQTLIRSSDSFEVDGVEITLAANAAEKFVAGEDVRFTAEPKTEEIIDAIKKMAEDYNEIVDLVSSMYSTKPDSDYYPLTEEEKAEMSEKEIELWEENAKKGILFGDSDLSALATDLRFMFSFAVDGAASVEEMGITLSSSYTDNGKISIDEDKLEAALENDIESVKEAFVKAPGFGEEAGYGDKGFMQRFEEVVDKYTNTIGFDKGIFIEKAGQDGAISEQNSTLQKQIDELQERYQDLLDTLEMEEDRYYAQFTALEVYTQQMNTQSSWLSSFGTSGF